MFLNTLKLVGHGAGCRRPHDRRGGRGVPGRAGSAGMRARVPENDTPSVSVDVPRDNRRTRTLGSSTRPSGCSIPSGRPIPAGGSPSIGSRRIAAVARSPAFHEQRSGGSDRGVPGASEADGEPRSLRAFPALPKHQGKDENFTAARFLRLQAEKLVAGATRAAPASLPVADVQDRPPPSPGPATIKAEPQAAVIATTRSAASRLGSPGSRSRGQRSRSRRGRQAGPTGRKPGQDARDPGGPEGAREAVPLYFHEKAMLQDVLKYIKTATAAGTVTASTARLPSTLIPSHWKNGRSTQSRPWYRSTWKVSPQDELAALLKQLDLAYCVRDGMVIISSVEGSFRN